MAGEEKKTTGEEYKIFEKIRTYGVNLDASLKEFVEKLGTINPSNDPTFSADSLVEMANLAYRAIKESDNIGAQLPYVQKIEEELNRRCARSIALHHYNGKLPSPLDEKAYEEFLVYGQKRLGQFSQASGARIQLGKLQKQRIQLEEAIKSIEEGLAEE